MSRTGATAATAFGVATLIVSGCHPVERHGGPAHMAILGKPSFHQVAARLTCPDMVGGLRRVGMSTDGRSCGYKGDGDEDVTLALMPLNGRSAQSALAPLETDLNNDIPAVASSPKAPEKADEDDKSGRVDLPGLHIAADGDKAMIRLPGVSIDAAGDVAHVRVPGVSVDADGDTSQVQTGWGGFNGAEIHADHGRTTVRAGSSGAGGSDLTYIVAADRPGPSGDRAVGYIARGPASGPLVVASFEAKGSDHGQRNDLSRLVNLNVD